MKKAIATVLAFIFVLAILPIPNIDAGGRTVVFLKDGGKSDGSTYYRPVGTLKDAYDALDLSKDCTIVICGPFNQDAVFSYEKSYTGSVLITSQYDGVDYAKTAKAEYRAIGTRFVAWGATSFDNVTVRLKENYFFIIGNCNPITIGEGVVNKFDKKPSGNDFGSGFSILGGYQSGVGMPEYESDKTIDITVLGGERIFICPFNRSIDYAHQLGKANITVGGKAKVGTICYTSSVSDHVICGKVEITVKDLATVNYIIASSNSENIDVDSVKINWLGGNIGAVSLDCARALSSNDTERTTDIMNGSVIRYADGVTSSPSFSDVTAEFDKCIRIGSAEDVTEAPETTVVITQPIDTAENSTEAASNKVGTGEYQPPSPSGEMSRLDIVAIVVSSLIIVAAAVIIIIIIRKD